MSIKRFDISDAVEKVKEIDPSLAPFLKGIAATVENLPVPSDPDIYLPRYRFDLKVNEQVGAFALIDNPFDMAVAVEALAQRMRAHICQKFGLEPKP